MRWSGPCRTGAFAHGAAHLELEGVQCVLADRWPGCGPERGRPPVHVLKGLWDELEVALPAAVGRPDETGVGEDAQVTADGGPRDPAVPGQVDYAHGTVAGQLLEQAAPHRVGDGGEDIHGK